MSGPHVTGEAADGREAFELVRGGDLDVLLMDLSMPDQSGVVAASVILCMASSLLWESSLV